MKDIDSLDLKGTIPFIAKIAKQGKNTRIITIPKKLWKTGFIDEDKTYRVYLVPINKRKDSKS